MSLLFVPKFSSDCASEETFSHFLSGPSHHFAPLKRGEISTRIHEYRHVCRNKSQLFKYSKRKRQSICTCTLRRLKKQGINSSCQFRMEKVSKFLSQKENSGLILTDKNGRHHFNGLNNPQKGPLFNGISERLLGNKPEARKSLKKGPF